MRAQLFSSKINSTKSNLEIAIEWQSILSPDLQKQITATHLASFLDLYLPYTEQQLGLKPELSKEEWLTKMIQDELHEVKQGKLFLATAHAQDKLVGFIMCAPSKARHENLKVDVYISLLAVKPIRDFKSKNKIRIGLGQQLVESAEARFTDANTLTLDTRYINQSAMAFYEKIGFNATGTRTFGGSNPKHYLGLEKPTKSFSP